MVSTYFTLARFLVLQGRLRRALAFLHLGFIFVRDRGFSECSTWPAAGWDVMLAGRSLTERVRQLDDESVLKLEPAHRVDGLRIAVVTICAYAADAPVRVLCEQNRQIYKALHGYDLHFFTDAAQILPNKAARMNVQDGIHKPFFWKVMLGFSAKTFGIRRKVAFMLLIDLQASTVLVAPLLMLGA